MRSHKILSFPFNANQLAQATLATASMLMLAACGGGGTTSDNGSTTTTTVSNSGVVQSGLRALPADFSTRAAVNYSPYRTGNTSTETVTDANVLQDLNLMAAAGIGLVRLFGSSTEVSARVLRLIQANSLDLKVQLGAYVNTFEYWGQSASTQATIQAGNNDELARCVALANSYPTIVEAVSVGNETMVGWSPTPISTRQMAIYLKTVRNQVTQPVTSDDDWGFYSGTNLHHPAVNNTADVLAQIDYVSMHSYASTGVLFDLFDWRQLSATAGSARTAAMMNAAMAKTQADYSAVRSWLSYSGKAKLPISVGETGWKAADSGGSNGQYRYTANPVNQAMYYSQLASWKSSANAPTNVFYFEAFDEPWKGGDDKWGLFNVNRQARYSIQSKYTNGAAVTGGQTWNYEYKSGSVAYTSADALYFTSPSTNTAVAASQYIIYADTVPTGASKAPQYWTNPATVNGLWFDPYDSGVAYAELTTAASLDTGNYLQFAPSATLGTSSAYGWGVLNHPHTESPPAATYNGYTTQNLSAFSGGHLNFYVKTNGYPGKIQVGVSTDSAQGVTQNFLVTLDSSIGSYGYCTTNQWCKVSIPLSALTAIPSSTTAPTAPSGPDWSRVVAPFILQDVFSQTGKTVGSSAVNNLPAILIDGIYFSQQ